MSNRLLGFVVGGLLQGKCWDLSLEDCWDLSLEDCCKVNADLSLEDYWDLSAYVLKHRVPLKT